MAVIATAAVVVSAVIGGVRLWPGWGAASIPDRVFVATFENGTGDPELDVLGEMVARGITQRISQAGIVPVVPAQVAQETTGDYLGDGESHDATNGEMLSSLEPLSVPQDSLEQATKRECGPWTVQAAMGASRCGRPSSSLRLTSRAEPLG